MGLAVGLAVGLAAGRRAVDAGLGVESRWVLSRGTRRTLGFWSVLPTVNSSALDALKRRVCRAASESVTVRRAGQRGVVVSAPAGVLFHPTVAALLRKVAVRDRAGTSPSFQVLSESAPMRTPGTEPVVTSTSSSNVASHCVCASAYRVRYMLGGNQSPAVR